MSDTSKIIGSEALGTAQRSTLAALLATMIPANKDLMVPSAGDEPIVQDVLGSIRTGAIESVIDGLRELDVVSNQEYNADFDTLDGIKQRELFDRFQQTHADLIRMIGSIVIQCYYRDDRVMQSLGMEPRAPFPKGFEVEQGDWSLLDPVKARGPIYKKVP